MQVKENSMNILSISGIKYPSYSYEKTPCSKRFGLMMSKPLTHDVVSFKGTPKHIEDRANAITMKLAKDINKKAESKLPYMRARIEQYTHDLVANTFNPENPVEIVRGRVKTPESIVEKALTRHWYSKPEILQNMTDILGMKIVMRDASKKQVDRVLDNLIQGMEEGAFKIIEIENKRPLPVYNQYGEVVKSYDYASPVCMAKLQRVASKVAGRDIKLIEENTPTNYMAIHLLLEFPNGTVGELQIMGHDVALLKDIEDLCYKVKGGKPVPKVYAKIEKALACLKPPRKPKDNIETPEYKEALAYHEFLANEHLKYTQEAYMYQREKEPKMHRSRRKEVFLKIPEFMPQELDFNYLYKLKIQCDEAKKRADRLAKK